jgi:hypothetical protein
LYNEYSDSNVLLSGFDDNVLLSATACSNCGFNSMI